MAGESNFENFGVIFRVFCDTTSIPGFAWVTMKKLSHFERLFWIIFNISILIVTTFLLYNVWQTYSENPTIITLVSSELPIRNMDFPGVSVCNVNKISRKRAVEYAGYLSQFDEKYDLPTLLEDIKLLGNLYDFGSSGSGRESVFHDFLSKFDNTSFSYDPTGTLIELGTPCHEMLSDCMWAGKSFECDALFKYRMTYDGTCCLFNYVRPISKSENIRYGIEDAEPPEVLKPPGAGIENGLEVNLRNDIDDYFLTTMEATGYTIHIFNSFEYPDQISGSFKQVFVNVGTEILITIDVAVVKPTSLVRALSQQTRSCIFQDESSTVFGTYRQSDCLVECKMRIILALCDCVPFTLPSVDEDIYPRICSLTDLHCLNEHKSTWSKYFPTGTSTMSLNSERYNSMHCTHCYPDCDNLVYDLTTSIAPIFNNSNNDSHLSVFFHRHFANKYKVDLTQTWFETISNFGGFLSLHIGLSVICAIEVVILIYRLLRCCIFKIKKSL